MPLYRDEAIVLRTNDLGEADRIVTALSRNHGKIRAVAKGVRRTLSKFGARLEPFSRFDAQFAEGRSLDVVTQAVGIAAYGGPLASDYERFTAASGIVETADRITDTEPSPGQFTLLGSALASLAAAQHPPVLIFDSYVLRAISIAGWAPSLDACAQCGRTEGLCSLSVVAGGVLCADCAGSDAPRVCTSVVEVLRMLRSGAWGPLRVAGDADLRTADSFVRAYEQYVLERKVRSLPQIGRGR